VRVLCHAQNFKGIGHFVRMHAIARGLAEAHEVYLVDGGRAVPHRPGPPRFIKVPRLTRAEGAVVPIEAGQMLSAVLEARASMLAEAAERIRPDAVLVDIYPFSKWEVDGEIRRAIAAARRANSSVLVASSLRDFVPRTRHEPSTPNDYPGGVLARLAEFDVILVHGDPGFARIEEYFGRAAEVPCPVHYTGFVARPPAAPADLLAPGSYAVLSCGGNARSVPFLRHAIEAFRRLSERGALGSMPLVVFPSPVTSAGDMGALRAATADGPFQLRDFSPDFDGWLAASALSISRCGYNTAVQILASRVRAVVVPNPDNSDQEPRGRRLAQLGLATVVEGAVPSVEAVAAGIEEALARPAMRHGLDLGGIAATRAFLERTSATSRAGAGSAGPQEPSTTLDRRGRS
jgi:predicted glycosyltransferase